MESIKQEEKYIACRYCDGIVYASQPVCSKCGLEMTSQGIVELSEVEDLTFKALDEIYKLRLTSAFFAGFTIIGFAFAWIMEMQIFFYIYFWMGVVTVVLNFFGWNQKYSAVDFTPEDSEIVKKNKRETIMFFVCNLIVGLGIHIFLLN